MPKNSNPTGRKRAREKAQAERNQAKQKLRLEKRENKANAAPRVAGEDPDLAGMVPGPQPRGPEWFDEAVEEEAENSEDERA